MERRQLLLVVGVVALLALAGAGMLWFLRRGQPEAETPPAQQVAQAPSGQPTGAPAAPTGEEAPAVRPKEPNRPDPFLPFDWVPLARRERVPETVLDYGFPQA